LLSGITAEQAAARPLPGAHTIWEITRHITVWERVFRRRLQGEAVSEPEEGDFPDPSEISTATWRKAVATLDEEHEMLISIVSDLSEDKLRDIVPGKEYSVEALLNGLIRHHVYHSGQIALLTKA
jgi:uncharacterized damage-inducible protein DinB